MSQSRGIEAGLNDTEFLTNFYTSYNLDSLREADLEVVESSLDLVNDGHVERVEEVIK